VRLKPLTKKDKRRRNQLYCLGRDKYIMTHGIGQTGRSSCQLFLSILHRAYSIVFYTWNDTMIYGSR